MNRKEMATLLWIHCEFPVRSAITAACLLRKMAENDAVDPLVSESMKANAIHFESLAVGVQAQALKDDRAFAEQALDLPLIIWRGMSLLDLTMEAQCYTFLEVQSHVIVCLCMLMLSFILIHCLLAYTAMLQGNNGRS